MSSSPDSYSTSSSSPSWPSISDVFVRGRSLLVRLYESSLTLQVPHEPLELILPICDILTTTMSIVLVVSNYPPEAGLPEVLLLKLYDIDEHYMTKTLGAARDLRTEFLAYNRLSAFQGTSLPILYGKVSFTEQNLDFRGLLLEYIAEPGIIFRDEDHIAPGTLEEICVFPHRFPKTACRLPEIAREVVKIATKLGDAGVVSRDAAARNIIAVCKKEGEEGFGEEGVSGVRIVLIDWANAAIRDEGMSDDEWRRVRKEVDVERVLGKDLMRRVAGFEYVHEGLWESKEKTEAKTITRDESGSDEENLDEDKEGTKSKRKRRDVSSSLVEIRNR